MQKTSLSEKLGSVPRSHDPFPAESLPANREGRLSEEQRQRYGWIARKRRRHFIQSIAEVFTSRGVSTDVRHGVVEADEGTVVASSFEMLLSASVDDRRMKYLLSNPQYLALRDGPTYGRLYYLPRSKLVVNFERLDSPTETGELPSSR